MRINIRQLGAKKPIIENQELEVENAEDSLSIRSLIKQIVTLQVEHYNKQLEEPDLITCLSHEDINTQAAHGKVNMAQLATAAKANLKKAIETALIAFEDGIYCIFIDGEQYESLDETIQLNKNSEAVFVRLTLLTGRPY